VKDSEGAANKHTYVIAFERSNPNGNVSRRVGMKLDPATCASMTWAGAQSGLQILGCGSTQAFDSPFGAFLTGSRPRANVFTKAVFMIH
jgi:hypothetical protein